MKKLIIAILFLGMANFVKAQSSKYNGTWLIDTVKSEFNNIPSWAASYRLDVDQTGKAISIKYYNRDSGGQRSFTENIGFDGKDYFTTTYSGKKRTSSIKQNTEGSILITTHTETPEKQPYNSIADTWSLSGDGKELIVDRTMEQFVPVLNYTLKLIYKRQ